MRSSSDIFRTEHEVVVVGARCAGAATAMLLARQGFDVAVVDRAVFPSDTISTHAIARGGVVQLSRWGLLDEVIASGAPKIRTVSFHAGGAVVEKIVKDAAGVDHLVAPRRHVLDTILVDAARRAGAAFEGGLTITGVTTSATGRITGVAGRTSDGVPRELSGRIIVGADGVRSRIARSVGARIIDERPADGATHYAYVAGLQSGGFEFHIGDRAFAGVFPTNGGEANVWICSPADTGRLDQKARTESFIELLGSTSPSLAARVRAGTVTSPVRSAVGFPNHVRQATGPGWALVGDASYHRDPISGHGITDAFRDAELLARHIGSALRGDASERAALDAFAAERHRALAPIFDLTVELASYPPIREFVALQRQLSRLIETEASWLADLPLPPAAGELAAA